MQISAAFQIPISGLIECVTEDDEVFALLGNPGKRNRFAFVTSKVNAILNPRQVHFLPALKGGAPMEND